MADEEFQFYFPEPAEPGPAPAGGAGSSQSIQVGGGFGAGPFGALAFGSGGGIDVAWAEQKSTNVIRVFLDGNVPIQNRGNVRDALYDRGWRLDAPNDPGVPIPLVLWAERDSSRSVLLYLDAQLAGPGRAYRVIASEALVGEPRPVSARSATFLTFGEAKPRGAPQTKKSFDLANEAPGVLPLDSDGDFRNDAGIESRKKRVHRRLSTPKGAYAHLPDYGLSVPLKKTFNVGDLRVLAADATAQVHDEGILDAQVAISTPYPGVVLLNVKGTGLDNEGVDVELRAPAA